MEGLINRQIAIFRVIGGDVVTTRKQFSSSRCVPSPFFPLFLFLFPSLEIPLQKSGRIRRKRAAEKRQGSGAKKDRSFRRNAAIDPSNGRHPVGHKIFTQWLPETLTRNEVKNYHRISRYRWNSSLENKWNCGQKKLNVNYFWKY